MAIEQHNTDRLDEESLQAHLTASAPALSRYIQAKIPRELAALIAVDDVLQEIWIAAFRGIATFRPAGPDALDRWLITIANRKLIDQLKGARRLKRGGAVQILQGWQHPRTSFLGLLERVCSAGRTPSSDASVREASRFLDRALRELPDNRRQALTLRYIEGRPPQEIAELMNKSESAVNSLLYHGLRDLRHRLGAAARYFSDAPSSEPVAE
jgi:RNA polymerase sigma-70 factor (ECF subfamily)